MNAVAFRAVDANIHSYELEFENGLTVEIRKAGVIWETWCCGLGSQHMFEDSAVRWAFTLAEGTLR